MTDHNRDGTPSSPPEPSGRSEAPESLAAQEVPASPPAETAPMRSHTQSAAPAPEPVVPQPSGKAIGVVGVFGVLGLSALFYFAQDLVPAQGLDPSSLAAQTSGIATVRAAAVAAAVSFCSALHR